MAEPSPEMQGAPVERANPLQRATGGTCRCGCGMPLLGKQTKWRYDAHRWKAWDRAHPRQGLLGFAQSPLPPAQDQRVDLAEEGKLRGDNALVLRRLRQGPATTSDVQAAAPRSMAVHSRVADVRAYLQGLGETVRRRKLGPRLHEYRIEAQP